MYTTRLLWNLNGWRFLDSYFLLLAVFLFLFSSSTATSSQRRKNNAERKMLFIRLIKLIKLIRLKLSYRLVQQQWQQFRSIVGVAVQSHWENFLQYVGMDDWNLYVWGNYNCRFDELIILVKHLRPFSKQHLSFHLSFKILSFKPPIFSNSILKCRYFVYLTGLLQLAKMDSEIQNSTGHQRTSRFE